MEILVGCKMQKKLSLTCKQLSRPAWDSGQPSQPEVSFQRFSGCGVVGGAGEEQMKPQGSSSMWNAMLV